MALDLELFKSFLNSYEDGLILNVASRTKSKTETNAMNKYIKDLDNTLKAEGSTHRGKKRAHDGRTVAKAVRLLFFRLNL